MSGRTPYASSMRVSARSVVSTAGWVISVCMSCCSSRCAVASSALSAKMYVGQRLTEQRLHDPVGLVECRGDQRLPLAKVASMLTYCEPWPV